MTLYPTPATPAQCRMIYQTARRRHGLAFIEADALARSLFGEPVELLSKAQAGEMIARLKKEERP